MEEVFFKFQLCTTASIDGTSTNEQLSWREEREWENLKFFTGIAWAKEMLEKPIWTVVRFPVDWKEEVFKIKIDELRKDF